MSVLRQWLNGVSQAHISSCDRGLSYGDGVFTTLAYAQGQLRWLDRHLQRLVHDSQRLGFPPLDQTQLQQQLRHFSQDLPDPCVVKVIITRGEGGRGYAPLAEPQLSYLIQAFPWPQWPAEFAETGVQAVWSPIALARSPHLAGLKHLNRLEQVLAQTALSTTQAQEAIMCDTEGYVVEGSKSNLFWVQAGQLFTPSLEHAGVAGIMRQQIIEHYQQQALPVHIGLFRPADLLAADEVFICNSLLGIWPVRELAAQQWPLGTLTKSLQKHFNYV